MWEIDVYQLEFIHPTLREVLRDYERKSLEGFYLEAATSHNVITSLYRIGDSGPHGQLPLRAVDIRFQEYDSQHREEFINARWIYDPERPRYKVALLHDVGAGLHLHLQVHRNTRRRMKNDE